MVLSISSFCFRISIHALRGEGDAGAAAFISYSQRISIHALRGEGDSGNILWASCYRNFNPRPPWGGRPFASSLSGCRMLHFNPRPPWGGRRRSSLSACAAFRISIHALRGEGDGAALLRHEGGLNISIHALRGEGDMKAIICETKERHFNPRPPWGGRPYVFIAFYLIPCRFQSTPSVGRATSINAILSR